MSDKKKSVDHDLIRELSKLLTETDLTEIEFEDDDMRIRVARNPARAVHAAPISVSASAPSSSEPSHRPAPSDDPASHPGALLSPMVGTAYLASEPGARPYIDVGESVREGQTVMIVEAMKTMNHIPATRSGKVTRILVEDGQPVEYGEPLMIIE